MSLQRVRDLVGERLDYLAFFITGVTPGSINVKIDQLLPIMPLEIIQKLCNVSLIAAVSNRPNVVNYIGRADNADLSRFITEHYYIQDHVNFSALNHFGHMLLAGGIRCRQTFVDEYRNKLGGISIWHANLSRSELSEKQQTILGEKIRRIPADVALIPSRDLVVKLANRLRALQVPVPPRDPPADNPAAPAPAVTTEAVPPLNVDPVFVPAGPSQFEVGSGSGASVEEVTAAAEEPVVIPPAEIVLEPVVETAVDPPMLSEVEIARKAAEDQVARDAAVADGARETREKEAADKLAEERVATELAAKAAADKLAEDRRARERAAKEKRDADAAARIASSAIAPRAPVPPAAPSATSRKDVKRKADKDIESGSSEKRITRSDRKKIKDSKK